MAKGLAVVGAVAAGLFLRPAPASAATVAAAPAAQGARASASEAAAPRAGARNVVATLANGPKGGDVIDTGDTAWLLTSTALVLFMTLPGLALFYGGLARSGSVLTILMQCMASAAIVTVLWTTVGYSLTFSDAGMKEGVINLGSFIGGFDKTLLKGVESGVVGTIPEALWFCFQLTFAIITPALIVGAFAERMKFSSSVLFMAIWSVLVYYPVGHMVWAGPGSLLGDLNALDFAGGLVVHLTSGVAAMVSCLMVGQRKKATMEPHNLPMAVIGAGMLWVGWFGFNAGSAVSASAAAAMAMAATQIAAAAACLAWSAADWIEHGKPTTVGAISGIVAGLVGITPCAGFVGPIGGLAIGALTALVCRFFVETVKPHFGYDDALDVVGVHGVGGFTGNLLAGVFAAPFFGGNNIAMGMAAQTGVQLVASLVVMAYTAVMTAGILAFVGKVTGGLRASEEEEAAGLDQSSFGETAYRTN